MRRSVRWLSIAGGTVLVLVLAVALFAIQLLYSAGQFKSIEPHFAGSCTPVAGLVGPEDITIHPRSGVAYISAYDRRGSFRGGSADGAIYAYDLAADAPKLVNLTPDIGSDFAPHGISLLVGDDGRDALYVINHAGGRHGIEIFDLAAGSLVRRERLSDPLLVSPNDLVAVRRDRLYVTNDHANTKGLARTLEDYLRRQIATVVHWDGQGWSVAAKGIRYPNGVTASPDGQTLYVASTTGREVFRFPIDPASGALGDRFAIDVGSGVDNIELDAAGDLWIGAHPQTLTFVQHAADATLHSPSQVFRIRAPASDAPGVEEVFLSRGAVLSGSSVGAVWRDRLLIGAVFDEEFLDCRMER
jgi:arylesterase/paraoxonase